MVFGGTRSRVAALALAVLAGATTDASAQTTRKKKPPAPSAAPAAPAAQAPAANKTRAAELYRKSADSYLHGDFAKAIELLDEAYALDPEPVLVYNQARAHEGLGHVDEAITLYERYLAQEPSSPDRGAIEQRLSTLRHTQEEKKRLESDKADVEQRRLQQEQQQRELEQRERDARSAPPPEQKRSVLPYVVAGVGVAGLATGTVFGFLALDKEDTGTSSSSLRDATDARDTGQTFAMVSNVSFIVGGVLFVGGAVWWAIDNKVFGGGKTRAAARPPVILGGTF